MPRPTAGLIVAISLTLAGCSTPTGPEVPPVSLAHTDAGGLSLLKVQLCHRDGDAGYFLIEVSVASEAAHREHGDAAVGEEVPGAAPLIFDANCTPISPSLTFAFEGIIGLSCFVCGPPSNSFGTGVVPGTTLSGMFTFDPGTPPTPTFDPNRVRYVGVTVQFTVGSETVSGNDPTHAAIEIYNGPPGGDSYSLIVGGGFSSGTIAGRSIDQFVWVVSGTSDLFSDTSLPLAPGFFGPGLGTRVCIGECFAGTILEGDITTLTLVPLAGPTKPSTTKRLPRLGAVTPTLSGAHRSPGVTGPCRSP